MTRGVPAFSEEVADAICRRIANGEGLRAICRDPDMPGRQTVLDWLDDESDGKKLAFRAKYARARELQGDFLDEEMQEVANAATPEDVQVARLRVGTMQWRASKLAPKKYGDRLVHAGDAENPVKVDHGIDLTQMSAPDRAILRDLLLRNVGKEPEGK